MTKEDFFSNHLLFEWTEKQNSNKPIEIVKAKGCSIITSTGREYIDMCSSQFNLHLGYQHENILNAIDFQLKKLSYAPANVLIESKINLINNLEKILPKHISKYFFTLGGADAIENALKIAMMYSGKTTFASFYRSYHGASLGALSISGDPRRNQFSNYIKNPIWLMNPHCSCCPFGQKEQTCNLYCIDHVYEVINYNGKDNIAGLIIETISCSSGLTIMPKKYVQKIREICTENNILLICDEVATGFGRTGKWFAFEHYGIVPDIIVMAKGLTNGYSPLGAVCVNNEIGTYFQDNPFQCGLTYGAHPLGCAAGEAATNYYINNKILDTVYVKSKILNKELEEIKKECHIVQDIRCIGLLGVIEISSIPNETNLKLWNKSSSIMEKIKKNLDTNGIKTIVRWNWIFIAPPYIISEEQLTDSMVKIKNAIKNVL